MAIDYSVLEPGQNISEQTYRLDADTVARYVAAVGDRSETFGDADRRDLAPPMAVAALSLRGVVNDLAIPGGTLHAGQELQFNGPVQIGETLECRATLLQNSVRGEWRFMVVEQAVHDGGGRQVMTGKSTIMVPA